MDKDNILVSIRCTTYNQEKYIGKCLEGFISQVTNFRFVAIVHDDASKDNTAGIIRQYAEKYPDIIVPIYETENQYSKKDGSLYKIMDRACTGKYIATCEGDDYWEDPYKLQKQVDYMESHPECNLVHTRFNYVDLQGNKISTPNIPLYQDIEKYDEEKSGYIWHYHLVKSTTILFCTCLFRRSSLKGEQILIDYGWFMSSARKGTVHFLNEITSCYRINPDGEMRTNQPVVLNKIKNNIFLQLYYFSRSDYDTLPFYRKNTFSRILVSEGIISCIFSFNDIHIDNKYSKLIYILFRRPLNMLLLPIAFCKKVLRRL